ncbi:acetylxylan esterase precursor [Coniochaeta sp. 2T2.1]|nr:acetylxylan esterase precursor [Coniochaeta sp. 2T2.1]
MKSTLLSTLSLSLALASSSPSSPNPPPPPPPNVCPQLHIFAARETTAPPGFGSAQTLVDLVTARFPGGGTTSEAIDYPAAPGDQYGASVAAGIAAVVRQTAEFAERCPGAVVVMHGYSQGAQIMDDAFCGGPDGGSLNATTTTLVSDAVAANVAAIVLMGDPRHVGGLRFNVGNATAAGFAARPPGFRCPQFEDRMQSYCDSPDPFCSNGSSLATHQGYGSEYGEDALKFIVGKVIV